MIIKDIDDALFLVTRITTTVLGDDVNKEAEDIDIDLTFTDDWPDGFARNHNRYLFLCSKIATDIRASSGRQFYYEVNPFLLDHESKSIKEFIVDSARLLLTTDEHAHVTAIKTLIQDLR